MRATTQAHKRYDARSVSFIGRSRLQVLVVREKFAGPRGSKAAILLKLSLVICDQVLLPGPSLYDRIVAAHSCPKLANDLLQIFRDQAPIVLEHPCDTKA